MIHQYNSQRFRWSIPPIRTEIKDRRGKVRGFEYKPPPGARRIGTIPVGTILYIQDGVRPMRGFTQPTIMREPWEVIAWLNREYHPAVRGGRPTTYMTGGHLALVRSLRTGRITNVADWVLLGCMDADLEWWRKPRYQKHSTDERMKVPRNRRKGGLEKNKT